MKALFQVVSCVLLVILLGSCKSQHESQYSKSNYIGLAAALRHHAIYDIQLADTIDYLEYDTASEMYVPKRRMLHHGARRSATKVADSLTSTATEKTVGYRQTVRQTAPASPIDSGNVCAYLVAALAILLAVLIARYTRKDL